MSDMKHCPGCEVNKPLSEFHKCYSRPQGVNGYCKICFRARHKLAYPRYRRRILAHSAIYGRTKRYGITLNDYNTFLRQQHERCAICHGKEINQKGSTRFCIDHDHRTGEVRGLLCHKCNKGLGNFKDSPVLLENAKRYLKRRIK